MALLRICGTPLLDHAGSAEASTSFDLSAGVAECSLEEAPGCGVGRWIVFSKCSGPNRCEVWVDGRRVEIPKPIARTSMGSEEHSKAARPP